MNILLFNADEISNKGFVLIKDPRRQTHLHKVIKPAIGDHLRVGQINGTIGFGKVMFHNDMETQLQVVFDQPSPTPLALKLLLAVPRPKMMRRILQTCATLGVSEITLLNSAKVEKSYWQTPFLQPQKIHENLLLGLEQAGTTQLPLVHKAHLFKPFVEDQLDLWADSGRRLVAHPRNAQHCPNANHLATTLAIGPEGGFTDYEVDMLTQQGFTPFSLGPRIMRVETAIPVAISRLCAL
ncbi:MAG: 16S rRNA (uracil(1498)-N(3))-methyltransferase [Gammaproteobacteria bacterium]|nr:16S rRNA (uracil(1498)-N(3))-methyltransferase [Gammaproteobacteria bacterium]